MPVGAAIGGSAIIGGMVQADSSRRAANTAADAQNASLGLQGQLFDQTKAEAQPYITGGRGAYEALLRTYGLSDVGFEGSPEFKRAQESYNAANAAPSGFRGFANALTARKPQAGPFEGSSAYQEAIKQWRANGGAQGQPDYSGFYNSPDYQFAFQQGQQAVDRSAAAKGRLYSGAQQKASQQFGQGLATQYLGNYRSGLQGAANTGTNALGALAGARSGYAQSAGQGYENLGNIRAAGALGQGQAWSNALGGIVRGAGYGGGGGPSSFAGGVPSVPSVGGNYDWYKPPGVS